MKDAKSATAVAPGQRVDGGVDDQGKARGRKSSHGKSRRGSEVAMIVFLVLVTGGILHLGKGVLVAASERFGAAHRVKWTAAEGVALKPGPPEFWYDATKGELVHIGAISSQRKHELTTLFSTDSKDAGSQQRVFWAAVDELAFASIKDQRELLVNLILLGGLAGALGVQLRSLVNFVGHACYTKSLDLLVWWPYYVVRPFTGFLLGLTIVVIVQAGLLTVGNSTTGSALWWTGLALLAGFGEQEFTQRLRLLTKAIFGDTAKEALRQKDESLKGSNEEQSERQIEKQSEKQSGVQSGEQPEKRT